MVRHLEASMTAPEGIMFIAVQDMNYDNTEKIYAASSVLSLKSIFSFVFLFAVFYGHQLHFHDEHNSFTISNKNLSSNNILSFHFLFRPINLFIEGYKKKNVKQKGCTIGIFAVFSSMMSAAWSSG